MLNDKKEIWNKLHQSKPFLDSFCLPISQGTINLLLCVSLQHKVDQIYSNVTLNGVCLAVEDLERHDGSAEKPYYMSKELMEILGKKNKPPGEGKEKKKGCCGCC